MKVRIRRTQADTWPADLVRSRYFEGLRRACTTLPRRLLPTWSRNLRLALDVAKGIAA